MFFLRCSVDGEFRAAALIKSPLVKTTFALQLQGKGSFDEMYRSNSATWWQKVNVFVVLGRFSKNVAQVKKNDSAGSSSDQRRWVIDHQMCLWCLSCCTVWPLGCLQAEETHRGMQMSWIVIHCKTRQPYCSAKGSLLTIGAAEPEESDARTNATGMFVILVLYSCQRWGRTPLSSWRFILWMNLLSCGNGSHYLVIQQEEIHAADTFSHMWPALFILLWWSASLCHSLVTGLVLMFQLRLPPQSSCCKRSA